MKSIAVYGRSIDEIHLEPIQSFLQELLDEGKHVTLYKKLVEKDYFADLGDQLATYESKDNLNDETDLIISIGGDGTLLDSTIFSRDFEIPILGLNTGRLGFLTGVSLDQLKTSTQALLNDEYDIEERTLICLETDESLFGELNFGLNELTLHKKDTSSMIKIHAYVNGEYLNSYWADGLIISTPTGSTAYSMSCGGPIVLPGSENFVITPIAPHNLNVRPIVIPDNKEIKLNIEGREKNFLVSLDSRSESIEAGKDLVIRKMDRKLKLLALPGTSYLKTIRKKLNWGLDVRN